jgi:hypothetical protein
MERASGDDPNLGATDIPLAVFGRRLLIGMTDAKIIELPGAGKVT